MYLKSVAREEKINTSSCLLFQTDTLNIFLYYLLKLISIRVSCERIGTSFTRA
jgi:hypothetical protein